MGFIIGLVIFGIPSAIIAGVKGFKPFRWLIAFGLIGLIVVGSMASATKKGISEDDARKIVKLTSTRSSVPEPLRVAHLIASGLSNL